MTRLFCLCAALIVLIGCSKEPQPTAAAPAPTVAAPVVDSTATPPSQAAPDLSTTSDTAQEVNAVSELLKKKHPELSGEVAQINRVAMGSAVLYEVVVKDVVFYTNRTVDYVLFGSLFIGDGKNAVNFTSRQGVASATSQPLTTDSAPEIDGRAMFNAIASKVGLSYTYGQPISRVVVFEDPDCGYCQQLHADLAEFGAELNIQVTVFPYVLDSHPNAVGRAKALMCATNPAQAWKDWMTAARGQANLDALWATWSAANAPQADCPQATVVDSWRKVGKELGFAATPTIMFENGMQAEGALTKKQWLETLAFVRQDLTAAPTTAPMPQEPAPLPPVPTPAVTPPTQ